MSSYARILNGHAEEALKVMSSIREISVEESGSDERIAQSLGGIHKEIVKGMDRIRKTLDQLMENVEWDSFNVSFFGETNAGKSTTIGALLRDNDEGIGDGRKDFTQRKQSRTWNGVHLMDMPGIEGNELKYENEIRTSVLKSHVIFYVAAANKEPEEGTLRKIKKYLKDQAKVYVILNIRGKPGMYARVKELISPNVQSVRDRTEAKLRSIIGAQYKGIFLVNSHLAYVASGRPARDEFIADRDKAISVFGSAEQAYAFSRFDELEAEIKRLHEMAPKEIAVNNTYKLVQGIESILSSLLREKKNFDQDIKLLKDQVKQATEKVEHTIGKYNRDLLNDLDARLERMKSDMQHKLASCIDNGLGESAIQNALREVKDRHELEIKDGLEAHIASLRSEIAKHLDNLRTRIDLGLKFNGVKNGDIDLGEIVREMKLSFKYIFDQVADLGFTIVGIVTSFAINPILGAVTLVVGVIRKIWDWFFRDPAKRKREAKDKAYYEIDKSINGVKKEMEANMRREAATLERGIKRQLHAVNQFVRSTERLSQALNAKVRELNLVRIDISNSLIEFVSGTRPQVAYLDLRMRRAVCILDKPIRYREELLQLEAFEQYGSINELLNGLDQRVERQILFYGGKDEFHYRMLSGINDYYASKNPAHPIKQVRRG
ncbi:GTPase [Cohnella thailandensis]|uniref:50S ribosome-binding GTPase n=1 Tax=Cohnella thailandensis TaxID=557557 RepID=A0A841SU23_9BACL|nr:GTPase [Cohnella thailandensis]MBB6633505.1 50S ribosome-binding GTPase [Cohnella thailandensis]MBP1974522.1 uncharacterized protein YicC (UPF0701 family) [Cohnella thailandensis]